MVRVEEQAPGKNTMRHLKDSVWTKLRCAKGRQDRMFVKKRKVKFVSAWKSK